MQSLDAYFGTEAPLNEDDKFLRQYVLHKVRMMLHSLSLSHKLAFPAAVLMHAISLEVLLGPAYLLSHCALLFSIPMLAITVGSLMSNL